MKRNIVTIAAFSIFSACQSSAPEMTALDSLRWQMSQDSLKGIAEDRRLADEGYTKSLKNGYLEMLQVSIVLAERGNHKLALKFTNISGKVIDGVQFNWNIRDEHGAFIGPAIHNNALTREKIKPGDTATVTWNLYESKGKEVKAYPVRIHFADGSSWSVN